MVASRACGLMVPSNRQTYRCNVNNYARTPRKKYRHTTNPALWSLNAIKSKKFTNWLNTILFVVASCLLKLVNSSTKASIFELDLHVSMLILPRIPCLGAAMVLFSSSSSAGPSRSMVSGRWQTGHSGYVRKEETSEYIVHVVSRVALDEV